MTIEEAIHELKIQSQVLESMILYNKDFEPKNDNTSLENKKNAIDIGIKALEKQIPKKPFKPFGTHSYKCSNCWKFVAHEVDDNFNLANLAEWCPYCGQKIDWKVEE
jgi:DNA-directed RNA polymerase subunit RPC12/RpoP